MIRDTELEEKWERVLEKLKPNFGEGLDIQAILFLIGVQELGKGFRKYKKDEKVDVMHVAICTLLSNYGYYEFEGLDADGWPHWKATDKLPHLKPAQQHLLMRQAVIAYFEEE
jgi:hypothetical protein